MKRATRVGSIIIFAVVSSCVEKNTNQVNERKELAITVDYSKSLEEMIPQGRYECARSDLATNAIRKRFPIQGTGKAKVSVVRFKTSHRIENYSELFRGLDKANLRPLKVEELLAFGAEHPNGQLGQWICGYGSWFVVLDIDPDKDRIVPWLYDEDGKRCFDLVEYEGVWPPGETLFVARK